MKTPLLFLLLFVSAFFTGEVHGAQTLELLYGSSINGEIEPCG
jgi:hypothetical protein